VQETCSFNRQISCFKLDAKFLSNCEICGKSTKSGTEVEVHQLSNFSYGATQDPQAAQVRDTSAQGIYNLMINASDAVRT